MTNKYGVTLALVAANLIAFWFQIRHGATEDPDALVAIGACCAPLVAQGEIFRLFSSLFLHIGVRHLMNNMLCLGAVGSFLEPRVGGRRLLLAFLLGGLFGNVVSVGLDLLAGRVVVSAGASGGIYALFGAIAILAALRRPQMRDVSLPRLAIALFLLAAATLGEPHVDVAAHAGGFLGGALVAAFWRSGQLDKEEELC